MFCDTKHGAAYWIKGAGDAFDITVKIPQEDREEKVAPPVCMPVCPFWHIGRGTKACASCFCALTDGAQNHHEPAHT